MKVEFCDVGRDKKTWTADIPVDSEGRLNGAAMFRSVRRVLVSRDISFMNDGHILVEGCIPAGRWRVIEDSQAE